jgi:Tol biopolymer transport system component
VAFNWDGPKQDNDDIYVKLIGPGEPLRITTDPAADSSPAWSPDGKWIAFERLRGQDAELLVVPALGGPERKLSDTGAGLIYFNPAWSPDSKWLVTSVQSAPRAPGALFLIPLSGGEKRRLTSPPPSSHGDGSPAFSPDGRAIVFSRGGSGGSRDFYLLRLTAELRPSGEPQRLTFEERGGPGSAWAADGKSIIYTYGIASYALWRLTLPGSGDIGSPQSLSFAGDGFMPCVSRQGNRLAFTRDVTDDNVWRAQLTEPGGTAKDPSSFIVSTRNDYAPQYSQDGKRIVFRSTRTGFREIWTSNSDGSNPVQLTDFRTAAGGPHWSPDGRQIILFANPGGPADIYSVSGDGGLPRRLTNDPAEDVFPIFSVDGQLVYFASNRTGRYEVFKMPAQGGEPAQVTKNGGAASQESPDGKFLYYMRERTRTSSLWRMPVTGGEEEKVLDSVSWFINFAVTPKGIYYIPARRDGQSFVEYLDLATRKVKPVFTIGSRPISQGLSVSPDERWILWTQTDVAGSDLMLVENFR